MWIAGHKVAAVHSLPRVAGRVSEHRRQVIGTGPRLDALTGRWLGHLSIRVP